MDYVARDATEPEKHKEEILNVDVKVEIIEEDEPNQIDTATVIKTENDFPAILNSEFKCSECLKIFKKERYLKMHIREVHTPVKMLLCHICSKEFKYFHLKRHIQNVHKTEC